MQVVSSTEFAAHQNEYFDMAVNQDVCIQRGHSMFRIIHEPVPEQPVLEPDDDFRRAISAEEFRAKALEIADRLDKKYALK